MNQDECKGQEFEAESCIKMSLFSSTRNINYLHNFRNLFDFCKSWEKVSCINQEISPTTPMSKNGVQLSFDILIDLNCSRHQFFWLDSFIECLQLTIYWLFHSFPSTQATSFRKTSDSVKFFLLPPCKL